MIKRQRYSVNRHCPHMKVMLDSGAYSAWTRGVVINVHDYIDFVGNNLELFDYYFNLDVIGNAEESYKNWLVMRKAGLNPIPVFHSGSPEKWLEHYLEEADYVAVGGVAKLTTQFRLRGLSRLWEQYLMKYVQERKGKVHGLGMTSPAVVGTFPWTSVDSSSAVLTASFGGIYLPPEPNRFDELDSIAISDQSTTTAIRGYSHFFALPESIQKTYKKMMREWGFEPGTVLNRQLRARVRSGKAERREPLGKFFDDLSQFVKEDEDDKPLPNKQTLVNDIWERFKFNLAVWDEWSKTLSHKTQIYIVVGGVDHLKSILEMIESPRVLVNYVGLRRRIMSIISYIKLGKGEGF